MWGGLDDLESSQVFVFPLSMGCGSVKRAGKSLSYSFALCECKMHTLTFYQALSPKHLLWKTFLSLWIFEVLTDLKTWRRDNSNTLESTHTRQQGSI